MFHVVFMVMVSFFFGTIFVHIACIDEMTTQHEYK